MYARPPMPLYQRPMTMATRLHPYPDAAAYLEALAGDVETCPAGSVIGL